MLGRERLGNCTNPAAAASGAVETVQRKLANNGFAVNSRCETLGWICVNLSDNERKLLRGKREE